MNPIWRAFVRVHTLLLRKTKGKRFTGGSNLLILTTIGARTGKTRATPLMYVPHEDDGYVIVASYAGNDRHPGWYHNLVKQPDVDIEIDGETRPVRARVADGDEREQLYQRFRELDKRFIRYENKTARQIPTIVLTPREPA